MIVLSNLQKLRILLDAAVATNELTVRCSYSDKTATTYPGATKSTLTNGTTVTDICLSPAVGTTRDIDNVKIYNNDSASAIVTVIYDDNGTQFVEYSTTLLPGEMLQYTHAESWKIESGGNAASSGNYFQDIFSNLYSGTDVTLSFAQNLALPFQVFRNGVETLDWTLAGLVLTVGYAFGISGGSDTSEGEQLVVNYWTDAAVQSGAQTIVQNTYATYNTYIIGGGGAIVPENVTSTPYTLADATTWVSIDVDLADVTIGAGAAINSPITFINTVNSGNNAIINLPAGDTFSDGVSTYTYYVLNLGNPVTFVKFSSTVWLIT